MQRCYNRNNCSYNEYGARGIYVCYEWRNSTNGKDNFVRWALNNGFKRGLSLDRKNEGKYHKLQNGPYASWNCKWSTFKEQANNRRSNVEVTINGTSATLAEWIDASGLNGAKLRKLYDKDKEAAIKIISDFTR